MQTASSSLWFSSLLLDLFLFCDVGDAVLHYTSLPVMLCARLVQHGDTVGTVHSGSVENSGFGHCMKGRLCRNLQLPCTQAAFALAVVGTGHASIAGASLDLFYQLLSSRG